MKTFKLKELDPTACYRLLISAVVPRPIAFVSTVDSKGQQNVAPFSFFNVVSANPPVLMISVTRRSSGDKKDTLSNILETKEFVVNSSNAWLLDAINQSSAEYPHEVSEFEKAGLTPVKSVSVKAPRVGEAAVHFECKLVNSVEFGSGEKGSTVVLFGEIQVMHVNEQILDEEGKIQFSLFSPLSRLGGSDYGLVKEVLTLKRPKIS